MNHSHKSFYPQGFALKKNEVLRVFFGVIALFAASQIEIPLKPVPMTLQTLGMLLLGLMYNPREAAYTTGTWFLLGALGCPIWAGYAGGLSKLLGPTGGYLVGLTLAPIVMAWAREKWKLRGVVPFLGLTVLGHIVLFALGLPWLSQFVGGWKQAIAFGFTPFLLWNFLKTILAVGIAHTAPSNER